MAQRCSSGGLETRIGPTGAADAHAPPPLISFPGIPARRPARWRRGASLSPFGAKHISARLVELTLGPLGPCPQVDSRFLQHCGARLGGGLDAGQLGGVLAVPPGQLCLRRLDAGLHGLAQFVTFPRGVGAHLVEHPARFLAGPVGVGPRRLSARLGCGGALLCRPGGFLVLACLLACLVAVGLGGADEGLGVGAGPVDRLLRFGGRAPGALIGGRDGGGLVRLGLSHRGVPLGGRGVDAGLCLGPDALQFCGMGVPR